MNKQQAEQIWDYYVGGQVSSREFIVNGQVSDVAVENQVKFATEQGWLPGGTLDIDADDLREAIRTIVTDDLA